jgi:hypothetical protein
MRKAAEFREHLQPVRVVTAGGRVFTFLSRAPSPSCIRLIGTRGLLGQKVRVLFPSGAPRGRVMRILWTCPAGDDLVENGGVFLADAPWP